MEYYVKSVVPIIESNYDKFTTVEKNIADFFIKNRKKVDFSAKAIAERLFVSEASLSRFEKKCGVQFQCGAGGIALSFIRRVQMWGKNSAYHS